MAYRHLNWAVEHRGRTRPLNTKRGETCDVTGIVERLPVAPPPTLGGDVGPAWVLSTCTDCLNGEAQAIDFQPQRVQRRVVGTASRVPPTSPEV